MYNGVILLMIVVEKGLLNILNIFVIYNVDMNLFSYYYLSLSDELEEEVD